MQSTRSEKKGVFQWIIPQEAQGEVASPAFNKFDRNWRVLYTDSEIRLQYLQGLEPIAIVARQVSCKVFVFTIYGVPRSTRSNGPVC